MKTRKKICSRWASLLLAVLLMLGSAPAVFAQDASPVDLPKLLAGGNVTIGELLAAAKTNPDYRVAYRADATLDKTAAVGTYLEYNQVRKRLPNKFEPPIPTQKEFVLPGNERIVAVIGFGEQYLNGQPTDKVHYTVMFKPEEGAVEANFINPGLNDIYLIGENNTVARVPYEIKHRYLIPFDPERVIETPAEVVFIPHSCNDTSCQICFGS